MINRPYSRTLLQAHPFDLKEFVYLTRDIPFSQLNACLNEHLNEVKKELGQLVNDEFSQFIRLYSDIGKAGTQEIEALEKRLLDIQLSMTDIVGETKAQMNAANELIINLNNSIHEHVQIKGGSVISYSVEIAAG